MLIDLEAKPDHHPSARADQALALALVLREEFGTDFLLFDPQTGSPIPSANEGERAGADPADGTDSVFLFSPGSLMTPAEVQALAADGRARVTPREGREYRLALLLYQGRRPAFVAAGVLSGLARTPAEAAREQARLQGWLQAVGDRLRLADQGAGRHRAPDEGSSPATLPWEALLALDQVMRHLRFRRNPEKNQQLLLEAAFGLLNVQALLWVPQPPDRGIQVQGRPPLALADARPLAALLARTPGFRPPGPLLLEDFPRRSGGARFAGVANLLAFQAVTDQGPLGWFIALNKGVKTEGPSEGPEAGLKTAPPPVPFRKSDAALLMPFVALEEMLERFAHRYQDLKDLLVGLTRSLTTALDAKDSFTFGHSERVARIAVELAREMGLDGEELGDVYLAGLLHDVGKIGIRDTVLLKPGPLTAEEQEHIKQHVTIGYSILADLRQIRNLLPGVLYHHERYDGTGYPDGLGGEDIPLLARILAVADGYDAMSNARPYREALPCRRVEEILLAGKGTQWDQKVVDAFMRCRHRVHTIRQRGVGDSLRLALEGTLRGEGPSLPPADFGLGKEKA